MTRNELCATNLTAKRSREFVLASASWNFHAFLGRTPLWYSSTQMVFFQKSSNSHATHINRTYILKKTDGALPSRHVLPEFLRKGIKTKLARASTISRTTSSAPMPALFPTSRKPRRQYCSNMFLRPQLLSLPLYFLGCPRKARLETRFGNKWHCFKKS